MQRRGAGQSITTFPLYSRLLRTAGFVLCFKCLLFSLVKHTLMSPARRKVRLTASWHVPCSSTQPGLPVIRREDDSLVPKSAHLAVNEFAGLMTQVARSGRPPVPRKLLETYEGRAPWQALRQDIQRSAKGCKRSLIDRPLHTSGPYMVGLHRVGLYGLICSCHHVASYELCPSHL